MFESIAVSYISPIAFVIYIFLYNRRVLIPVVLIINILSITTEGQLFSIYIISLATAATEADSAPKTDESKKKSPPSKTDDMKRSGK